jgi:eukaryotic-like serine/threonine-protein kinase
MEGKTIGHEGRAVHPERGAQVMETGQTVAGKYRLIRLLGSGGMASVWSATNVFTEREFAIKFMLPQLARTPEAAARFLLEAKVSARINHPNIIEVIDVGQTEDGSLFLVMELLTGASLEVAIRRQRQPMAVYEFMVLMRDVALALAAAHRSGVIHRDLKPTNIFLHSREGRLVSKVLDFGVSKILEEEQNTSLTIAGTVLGSPHYMSPEQAMGAAGIDGRTDVFAFGGILFEALTGRRPYDAPNFNALIVAIATKQPERIDDVAPHLPAPLRALVRDCLITAKEARVASFDLIADRISAMLPDLDRPELRLPGLASADPLVTMQVSTLPPSTAKPVDATLVGLQAVGSFVRHLPRVPYALAAGGVLLLGGVVAVTATIARHRGGWHSAVASPAAAVAPPKPLPAPTPTTSASSDVPVISVDSLPVVSRAAPKANGRMSITASPGWCSVSVDGAARGVTPLTGYELPVGVHRIDCVSPTGRPRSANVTVSETGTAHHAFTLEE